MTDTNTSNASATITPEQLAALQAELAAIKAKKAQPASRTTRFFTLFGKVAAGACAAGAIYAGGKVAYDRFGKGDVPSAE